MIQTQNPPYFHSRSLCSHDCFREQARHEKVSRRINPNFFMTGNFHPIPNFHFEHFLGDTNIPVVGTFRELSLLLSNFFYLDYNNQLIFTSPNKEKQPHKDAQKNCLS